MPLNERLCIYCNELGDEFHYRMSCKHFEEERKQCLKSYFYKCPKIIKFEQLLNLQLYNLAIEKAMQIYKCDC